MLRPIWAALENLVPRGLGALSTVVAALVTNPHAIGMLSWATLSLTFYQALTDQPIRHLGVPAIRTKAGRRFLARYAFLSSAVGAVSMSLAVLFIAHAFGLNDTRSDVLSLLPLVIVPVARGAAVTPTALAQLEGLWARISLHRTLGALIGAAIGLPIVLQTKSVVGACIAIAASEVFYTLFLRATVALYRINQTRDAETFDEIEVSRRESETFLSSYCHMALYSFIGWLQSLSERALVGFWAGTAALGTYSLGTAVGRSSGDAIAASQPTLLRTDLSKVQPNSNETVRAVLGRSLRVGIALALVNAALVTALAIYVLPRLLSPNWATALQMAPILALTAVPLIVAASSAPVHVHKGTSKVTYLAPAICLIFAPLTALTAVNTLVGAAWIVLIRECILAMLQAILMGRSAPWREIGVSFISVAIGAVTVVILRL